MQSTLKSEVIGEIERFVNFDPDMVEALLDQRKAGALRCTSRCVRVRVHMLYMWQARSWRPGPGLSLTLTPAPTSAPTLISSDKLTLTLAPYPYL